MIDYHIHPDYSYGRNAFDHFKIALEKLIPGTQVVSEGWPKLGTTDFTSHITKAISAKPDLLVSSVWGGDYVAFYKALGGGWELYADLPPLPPAQSGPAPGAPGQPTCYAPCTSR